MYNIVETDGMTVVHYFYPIENIREEVTMRTSYLGRFRKTEESAHLLDMLSFTKDEADLFYSFLKSGMSLIFSFIGKRTKRISKAYRFEPELNDTEELYKDSVHYTIEWEGNYNRNFIEPVDQHLFDAIVWYIIWRWLMLHGKAFKDDADNAYASYLSSTSEIDKDTARLIGAIVNKIPRIF